MRMRIAGLPLFASALLTVSVPAVGLHAQAIQLGVSGGVAVPVGAWGETRTPGPVVRASATLGAPTRAVRARADLEGAWLFYQADRARGPVGSNQQGDLRALSAVASILVGGTGPRIKPYLVAGLSAQRLTVEGARNPYGTTAGLRIGAGLRWRIGRAELHGEITRHSALTDFATGQDAVGGVYIPIVVGVSF